jgi:hypothetical protein
LLPHLLQRGGSGLQTAAAFSIFDPCALLQGAPTAPQVQARSPSKALSSVFFATLSPIRLEARYGPWIFLWTSFNVTFTAK